MNKINEELIRDGEKFCPVCKTFKSFDSFYARKERKIGLSSWCKDCSRIHGRNKKREPGAYAIHRKHLLRREYGLVPENIEQMRVLQNNVCDICGISFDEQTPHVDHDHDSKVVRGLLCGSCNRGIGLLKDSADILERAAKYIRDNSSLQIAINIT